ncbi:hypothetical protein [Ulvibacterium marinum]|uniref:DUF4332 domain-containing protein n=1 Tax=Ulvibacterium marinum TaxID=2419782 RepID=A0A3B0CDP4_9FLAO|nr:hypothetical protein [Ulvibacterium marinum]RKN83031.1 hypothetical protein D7Z94_04100 [Ulvibacterium marinum]
MDFSTMNIWCLLIPLLVGILCAFFGYLIGKGKDNSKEIQALQASNAKLKSDLNDCNNKLKEAHTPAPIPFDAAKAKAVFGKTIKQDDLKLVEGIGPKIMQMFQDAGIKTWKDLSETPVARCKEILETGGERYKVHDPASWPMQAKMAYEGKWKELFKWQEEHDHGKL